MARGVPFCRKRSGPFVSGFRSSTASRSCAVQPRSRQHVARLRSRQSSVDDIAAGDRVRDRATIIQHKTGPPGSVRDHGAHPRLAAGVTECTTEGSRPLRLSEPRPRPAPPLGAPIRAHCAWLDRGHRDGQLRLRDALDASRQRRRRSTARPAICERSIESTVRYLGIDEQAVCDGLRPKAESDGCLAT